MTACSRRLFLKQLGAVAGFTFTAGSIAPLSIFAQNNSEFEVLVGGDSFIWGQGLQEKDKFYSLIRDWLANDVFGDSRRINLTVKAHSGARIRLHDKQVEKMKNAGQPTDKFYYPEADISFPSITTQIDTALREYADPRKVKLVMLSGGITDLVVGNAINPFMKKSKFLRLVHTYCHEEMGRLLAHVTDVFPEAVVAVFAYFPIVSTKSDMNKITKYLMKMVRFPHQLQWLLTNGFSKQFMKIVRKATSDRSRLWFNESNKELADAVAKTNERLARPRVVFVPSPVTEETCFATPNSLLWSLDKDNRPEDDIYAERLVKCPEVFNEIKYKPFGPLSVRLCELASVAHVNKAGSIAYAEAAKPILRPFFAAG